jgi:hypothetical protein
MLLCLRMSTGFSIYVGQYSTFRLIDTHTKNQWLKVVGVAGVQLFQQFEGQ